MSMLGNVTGKFLVVDHCPICARLDEIMFKIQSPPSRLRISEEIENKVLVAWHPSPDHGDER